MEKNLMVDEDSRGGWGYVTRIDITLALSSMTEKCSVFLTVSCQYLEYVIILCICTLLQIRDIKLRV
jgi:hypothetical protein